MRNVLCNKEYIYVLSAGRGPVKVGRTARPPEKRLSDFRANNPTPDSVTMVFAIEIPAMWASSIERRTFGLLIDGAHHNEWFDVSAEEAVRAVKRAVKESRLRGTVVDVDNSYDPTPTIGRVVRWAIRDGEALR